MIDTTERVAWLAERQTGIGASEAAAALGVDPHRSRVQLWGEKTGMVPRQDLSDYEPAEWGLRLQAPIAEAFRDRTGRLVTLQEPPKVIRHDSLPWLLASLDAYQVDPHRERGQANGALEIKTASVFASSDWDDEPPLLYQVQLQHQLAVTGFAWGTLCVLLGGQRMRWFDMARNDRFIEAMIAREQEFWRLVETRTMPEPDGTEATAEALRRLYPRDNGAVIELPAEAAEWDRDLQEAKAAIKTEEARKELAENRIKAALAEAQAGILPSGALYTYKTQTTHHKAREAFDSTFRVLRRKER